MVSPQHSASSPSAARRPRPRSLALALALCAACASSGEDPEDSIQGSLDAQEGDGFARIDPAAARDTRSVGLYIADLDKAIRAWQEKTWNADSDADRKKQDQLEIYLETESRKRREVLITELETGPVRNRSVAATALGFTRDPLALSPLLAALEDPSPRVVKNALIGLSLLLEPATPLDRVGLLMEDADAEMRGNAAYCARCLVEAGADGAGLAGPVRGGLIDESPIVRSQCALLTALLIAPEPGESALEFVDALDSLANLLDDEVPLVRAAAARAIAYTGRRNPELKGRAARALAREFADEDNAHSTLMIRSLILLGERNYGDDEEAWIEWAARLP